MSLRIPSLLLLQNQSLFATGTSAISIRGTVQGLLYIGTYFDRLSLYASTGRLLAMVKKDDLRNISILIGHANAMSCGLLVDAFKRQSQCKVVACATTSEKVVEAVRKFSVDVALISSELQDGRLSGFVALRELHEHFPGVRSVMLLDSPDPNLIVDSFRSGAKGVFCPSQSQFKTLCRCVSRVHAGQVWADSTQLAYVMEAFVQFAPLRIVNFDGINLLARREEDVVRLVADGLTNRDIARELNLSEHTVKNYLFHIFDKLGVSSRVELALYSVTIAKRAGIVDAGRQVSELAKCLTR